MSTSEAKCEMAPSVVNSYGKLWCLKQGMHGQMFLNFVEDNPEWSPTYSPTWSEATDTWWVPVDHPVDRVIGHATAMEILGVTAIPHNVDLLLLCGPVWHAVAIQWYAAAENSLLQGYEIKEDPFGNCATIMDHWVVGVCLVFSVHLCMSMWHANVLQYIHTAAEVH